MKTRTTNCNLFSKKSCVIHTIVSGFLASEENLKTMTMLKKDHKLKAMIPKEADNNKETVVVKFILHLCRTYKRDNLKKSILSPNFSCLEFKK